MQANKACRQALTDRLTSAQAGFGSSGASGSGLAPAADPKPKPKPKAAKKARFDSSMFLSNHAWIIIHCFVQGGQRGRTTEKGFSKRPVTVTAPVMFVAFDIVTTPTLATYNLHSLGWGWRSLGTRHGQQPNLWPSTTSRTRRPQYHKFETSANYNAMWGDQSCFGRMPQEGQRVRGNVFASTYPYSYQNIFLGCFEFRSIVFSC